MLERQPQDRFGLTEILSNGWLTRGGLKCTQPDTVSLGSIGSEDA